MNLFGWETSCLGPRTPARAFSRWSALRQAGSRTQRNAARIGALTVIAACLVGAATVTAWAGKPIGDDVPAWLQAAAKQTVPTYGKDVSAVMLHNECRVTVGDDGRIVRSRACAVRFLTREGRDQAAAYAAYFTDGGKVRDIRAWMLRPTAEVKRYGKDDVLDAAIVDNDIYNEVRVKLIAAREDVEPGGVFGFETTVEENSVFTQEIWDFQNRLPALVSRFTLALPTGWRADGMLFNHPKFDPAVTGTGYTWELRNLPPLPEESDSPPVTNLAPRLAVSFFPTPGTKVGPAFASWTEVSKWLTGLSDPSATASPELTAKARDLTASAKNDFERIRAIGEFVQSVKYISIQTGIGRGGGYKPHAASEVFAKFYGDCKDKANLMRTMLKAVGIDAYLVSIYAGDPSYVRQEWASPQQFNHCIIAVKANDSISSPITIAHPKLGRLLIFDPTDETTPVGDLPDHEQGSLALIVAGDLGTLERMPATPPEANRLECKVTAAVGPEGTLTATIEEESTGQAAARERRTFKRYNRTDYVKLTEGWLGRGIAATTVAKVDPTDDTRGGRFRLNVEMTARGFGQLKQGRLMVFKPAFVPRRQAIDTSEAIRTQPLEIEANAYTETVRITVPEGFEVDEIPDPVKLDMPFGSYASECKVEGGKIVFTRSLVLRATTLPAVQYPVARLFFGKVLGAEQTPVVLVKK